MPLLEQSLKLLSREFHVLGSSMEPAFRHGMRVRLSPVPYLLGTPMRGDIVGLRPPNNRERLDLKRVLGLPGEHVSWRGSQIWINGRALEETYVRHYDAHPGDYIEMLDLGPGEYFVAGDHRLYSTDSRNYGPVWLSDILGRIVGPTPTLPVLASHTPV
jgi:signal peptidase I